MFIRDSATAMRAEAAGEIKARRGFSPMAIASPVLIPCSNEVAVTDTSDTGVCHLPTIWSRAVRPPTVRSPIVIKKDLEPTAGRDNTRLTASLTSSTFEESEGRYLVRLESTVGSFSLRESTVLVMR